MTKKQSNQSAETTGTAQPKTRQKRDHNGEFKFYLFHNIPGNTLLAVKHAGILSDVFSVNDDFHMALTELPDSSIGHAMVAQVLKSRGGPAPFATMTLRGVNSFSAVRDILRAMFIALPHDVQFILIDKPEERYPDVDHAITTYAPSPSIDS
jgi:hypothetical protein